MKKLIKADLCDILRLIPVYQSTNPAHIEGHIAKLEQAGRGDFLFLNRREKSFLFTPLSVCVPGSYENLAWTYGQSMPWVPVVALLLHVSKVVDTRPFGTVTILDYPTFARDIEVQSALPVSARRKHIAAVLKRSERQARCCTTLEFIQFLKDMEVK